jgi:hypothetical protein
LRPGFFVARLFTGIALGLNGALPAIVLPIVLPGVFALLEALHR